MTSHRQSHNLLLEEQVRDVVAQLGLAHRFRFDQHQAATAGIANPRGEIDLLIADPATGRLWVCEVKDNFPPFSTARMRQHVRNFTRRDGHIAKLCGKAEQIRGLQQLSPR
jgi:hypothetical protein